MIKFERILTFIKVIETQSFSQAAQKLSISGAAVSKQIHALESEIGTQLIHRTTRRLTLTEAGLAYYEQCQRLMLEVEATESLSSGFQREPAGTLRAFVARYFGEKYLIPHLPEFITRYPKLKLDLEFGERIPNSKTETIDLIFGLSIPGPENWIQKKLGETRYVFCASPTYLKKFGTPQTPQDLTQHYYLHHRMRRPENTLEFSSGAKLPMTPFLSLNDTRALLECALNHLGIVQLHHYAVAQELATHRLEEVLHSYGRRNVPISLQYRPYRFPQPKIRKFIDFFSQKMEESNALPHIKGSPKRL